METGQKNMIPQQNNNNNNISTINRLSVQVSLNGLSFLIMDVETSQIVFFKEIPFSGTFSPEEVLLELKKVYENEVALNAPMQHVAVLHENNLHTLVPKSIFQEESLPDYLKYNAKLLPTDYISFDTLEKQDLVNVYVPFTNINNYFFDLYGTFDFYHTSTIFIEKIIATERNEDFSKMYIQVFENRFDVLVTKNKKVHLYNSFTYATAQDFIYYILFVAEQLQLNPEKFPVYLYGRIQKNDGLYTIAYTYIRNLQITEIDTNNFKGKVVSKSFLQTHNLLFTAL
jgi:hypothetical protein